MATLTYLETTDFEKLFSYVDNPVILNDVPYVTKEDRDIYNKLLVTTFDDTDILSAAPTCQCKETTKGFFLNVKCPFCKTQVLFPGEGKVDLRVWIKVPEGIKGYISPRIYGKLNGYLGAGSYGVLKYLLESKSTPVEKISKTIESKLNYLDKIGFPRGINNFIDHYDDFLEIYPYLANKVGKDFVKHLKTVKHLTFPTMLPLPNKGLIILENTPIGSFADKKTVKGVIDAARTVASFNTPRLRELSIYQKEVKVNSIIGNLVSYYDTTIRNVFCKKKGIFRSQWASFRGQFCVRAVVTSIEGPHSIYEIHVPWAQGLEVFKYHLCRKLEMMGYHSHTANAYVENSGNVYDPLLDRLLQELLAEARDISYQPTAEEIQLALIDPLINDIYPSYGFPCEIQRNPSIDILSAVLVGITKVKTNIKDKTVSLSPLILKGMNCDFDGDELNIWLIFDKRIYFAAKPSSFHFGIHDQVHLGKLRSVAALPDVTIDILANWVN